MYCHRKIWTGTALSANDLMIRTSVQTGTLRRRHDLPFPGEILVSVGDEIEVGARWAVCHPVGRTSIRDITRVSRVPPAQAREATKDAEDREVPAGAVIAKGAGMLLGSAEWVAPWNGRLVHVSSLSGLGFFQETIDSIALFTRLSGTVIEVGERSHIVIEGNATSIGCAFGAGGTSFGRILVVTDGTEVEFPVEEPPGPWIVVATDAVAAKWIDRLPPEQTAAIVAPSMPVDAFFDMKQSPDNGDSASAQWKIPTALTEGICSARMPPALQQIFRDHEGQMASVVAASTPGEAEVVLIDDPNSADPDQPTVMRIAAGPDLGTQVLPRESEAVDGRNGAGVLGRMIDLHREEGGRTEVIAENLERLS